MKQVIYIADDEENIRNIVKMFLESDGYCVRTFENGDGLFAEFIKKQPDLVILDIMMPGTDGLTICNKIREISSTPIILLTAKDSETDYIAGITLGSDDYITKPFRPTILNMRVKAILRRVEMSRSDSGEDIRCGTLNLSEKSHEISCRDVVLSFTPTEFSVMRMLMTHFGEAVSRNALLEEVWGYSCGIETRVTDETIRKIRKKIHSADCAEDIVNIWGFGYKLCAGGDNADEK